MSKHGKVRRLAFSLCATIIILACSMVQINLYDTPASLPTPTINLIPTIPILPTQPPAPTQITIPTIPGESIPGLAGSWQQGARVFTIVWQNDQYVVTDFKVGGSANSQLIDQSWNGTTLSWTSRSHPANNSVTYVVQSVNADLLSATWTDEKGYTGPAYLRRVASPVPAFEPLPYFDDFSSPSTGWDAYEDEYGIIKYESGTYTIRTKIKDWYADGWAFRYFRDVVITLNATSTRGPSSNDYGFAIGCKTQINGDTYWFEVLMSGYYYVGMWTDNGEEYVNLLPGDSWRASNAIHTGRGTNHVSVTCNNGFLKLEVNGETLFQGTDYTFSDGDIVLSVISYSDLPAEFQFDDLSVTAP